MISNKEINYNYLMYIIFGITYIVILKEIFIIIDVYHQYIKDILILLFVFLGLFLYKINKYMIITYYFIHLSIFLFFRESKTGINLSFYLLQWLNNIWNNKVIFINVIGNILLFIPLGIIYYKNILYAFLFIIFIELFQVILKKGIFDIVDIILNTIGILIGLLGVIIWLKIKTRKNAKLKMKWMK